MVSLGFSRDFATGQAARALIGQISFTAQVPGATDSLIGGVSGVAYANGTLVVADSNRVFAAPENNRVLLFRNLNSTLPAPTDELNETSVCPICAGTATTVLGQPDFTTTNIATTQSGLRTPTGVATDGRILVVADTDNNRVLIWKSIPSTNGQPADVVVGQPNFTSYSIPGNTPTASTLRGPQGVWLQNGKLFVADTQYNRVLIWNSIPTKNGQPADVVVGQPTLTTSVPPDVTTGVTTTDAKTLLNPVSVTSDGQRLYVADLGNNRVAIWNSIPTANGQQADVVIGQPDMTSTLSNNVTPTNNLCPFGSPPTISISSATNTNPAVFTATGHGLSTNQYIIISGATGGWASINGTFQVTVVNADTFTIATNSTAYSIDSTNFGTLSGTLTFQAYPARCSASLNFPRFALSDGQRLFIADGGNDRVLIFNSIPKTTGAGADIVLGQPDDQSETITDTNNQYDPGDLIRRANPDTIRTPMGLAWDGTNLFVSDPYDRRVMVFTPGDVPLPMGVRNAASIDVFAVGTVTMGGTITQSDIITVTINTAPYTYTVLKDDTLDTITTNLANLINSANGGIGDFSVLATLDLPLDEILLTARTPGTAGNNITLATTVTPAVSTNTATETATTSGSTLAHGGNAAAIAPGTIVSIFGNNLSDTMASAPNTQTLPTSLGGVEVYFNGIRSPVLLVSPTQVNAQVPFELLASTGINCYVRIVRSNGLVEFSNAVGVPIVAQNPGVYTQPGNSYPLPAVVQHGSSYATGTVSVDGSIAAGDVATVTIEDRSYTYIVQSGDTLDTVRDSLIALISQDPKVTAFAAGPFDRIRLRAKIPGPAGNGIVFGASVNGTAGGSVILSPTNTALCCANVRGAPVTQSNPAISGETIIVYATGMGLVQPDAALSAMVTGGPYQGPALNTVTASVDSLAGGKTANVLFAGLEPGYVGLYQVELELNSGLTTDMATQLTIAQDIFVSNIVTVPVVNPTPSNVASPVGGSLTAVSGSGQFATVNKTFSAPLVVKAADAAGSPVNAAPITWAVTSGSALLSGSSTLTNTSGESSITVTAGSTTGVVVITATWSAASTSGGSTSSVSTTFTLTVTR